MKTRVSLGLILCLGGHLSLAETYEEAHRRIVRSVFQLDAPKAPEVEPNRNHQDENLKSAPLPLIPHTIVPPSTNAFIESTQPTEPKHQPSEATAAPKALEEHPDTKQLYQGGFIQGLSLPPEALDQIYRSSFELSRLGDETLRLKLKGQGPNGEALYFSHPHSVISGEDPDAEGAQYWQTAEGLFMPLLETYLHERFRAKDKLVDLETEKKFAHDFINTILQEAIGADLESKHNAKTPQVSIIKDYLEYQAQYFKLLTESLRESGSEATNAIELRLHGIEALKSSLGDLLDRHRNDWSNLKD